MMAFQAGGPHAQDRALEAVAYAWDELRRVPAQALWEKPQGKNEPIRMEKHFRVVPRGVALVIGCCTFPTWNGYPGMFASLATGNAVIVKPHPGAILPLAITVGIAREVLAEAGFDPNVVTLLAHEAGDDTAAHGRAAARGEDHRLHRQHRQRPLARGERAAGAGVYRKGRRQPGHHRFRGRLKGVARNIAFSLALYSGQMCTAPQNIYIPKDGIATTEGPLTLRPGRRGHRRGRAEIAGRSGARRRSARRAAERRRGPAARGGPVARDRRAGHAGDCASCVPGRDGAHAAHRQAQRHRPRRVPQRVVRPDRLRHQHGIDGGEPRHRARHRARAWRAYAVGVFDQRRR